MTVEPPVLVTVSNSDCLAPMITLPNPRLVGFGPNAPGATSKPDNGMFKLGFDAVEVIVTLPLTLPTEAAVNVMLKLALCPDVSVTGVVIPLKLNPVPLIPT